MKTKKATVALPCVHCGARIEWSLEDLRYHLRRLDQGDHAACACDDDCAFESAPWTEKELRDAIRELEADA